MKAARGLLIISKAITDSSNHNGVFCRYRTRRRAMPIRIITQASLLELYIGLDF